MNYLAIAIFVFFSALSNTSNSEEIEVYSTLDAVQKKEATTLYNQVKCPTCNGQYIKESNTPSAKILRDEIATQVKSGKSLNEIEEALTAQFGEEIIDKSSYTTSNFFMWLLPAAFLFFCLFNIRKLIRL